RSRLGVLPVVFLDPAALAPVNPPAPPRPERRAVTSRGHAVPPRLDADDAHAAILDEGPEEPDGVGAAPHAGDDRVGQLACELAGLRARLLADHPMEVAHHHRIRMRAEGRA